MSLRDDNLWDELRYWLKNPVTEHEQSFREKQENAYINRVLNKAFGIKDEKVSQIKAIAENESGNNYFYKIVDSNQIRPKARGLESTNNNIQDPAPKFKTDEDWLEWFKRGRGYR